MSRHLNTIALLEALNHAQQSFIGGEHSIHQIFDNLLSQLLHLTESEYGFIGKVLYKENQVPFLKIISLTNIAWNATTQKLFESNEANGLEFHNLKTLFGEAMTTGEVVISNTPYQDPRRGGLPHGHPAMNSFLGIPLKFGGEMIGMIGVANRENGYQLDLIEFLKPFISTCAVIIAGLRNQELKEEEFLKNQELLENEKRLNVELSIREEELITSEEELNRTLLKVKSSEDKLKAIYNSTLDGHLFISKKFEILYFNRIMDRFARKNFNQAIKIGDNVMDFVIPTEKAIFLENMLVALKGNRLEMEKLLYFPGEKVNRWVKMGFNPVLDEENSIIGVAYNAHDITQRKEDEIRLKQHHDQLKEIAETHSHELRRPVATVLGLISLLEFDKIIGDNLQYIQLIHEHILLLDRIIHKIVHKANELD
jgi:PAS domain-containing protein